MELARETKTPVPIRDERIGARGATLVRPARRHAGLTLAGTPKLYGSRRLLDTLCHDNGGVSGASYWGGQTTRVYAQTVRRRDSRVHSARSSASGSQRPPTLWAASRAYSSRSPSLYVR